jgi:hypothetical protein
VRRRYWALVVVALGGTLLNLQVLAGIAARAARRCRRPSRTG